MVKKKKISTILSLCYTLCIQQKVKCSCRQQYYSEYFKTAQVQQRVLLQGALFTMDQANNKMEINLFIQTETKYQNKHVGISQYFK